MKRALIIGVAVLFLGGVAFLLAMRRSVELASRPTPETITVAEQLADGPIRATGWPQECGLNLQNELVKIEEVVSGGFKVVTAPWEWYTDDPFPEVRFTVLINEETKFCEDFSAEMLGPDEPPHYSYFLFRTKDQSPRTHYPDFAEGSVVTAAEITIP